jgi:hypothetical protein
MKLTVHRFAHLVLVRPIALYDLKNVAMRLQTRTFIIQIILSVGWFYSASFSIGQPASAAPFLFMFAWAAVTFLLSRWLLRCPHCGRYALKTFSGLYVPWAGYRCRYCGKPY